MFFSIIKLFFVNLIIFPIILNAMIENGQNSQYDQEIVLENYNKEHLKEMIDILTKKISKEITEKETLDIVEEIIDNAYNINKKLYDFTNEFINQLEEEQIINGIASLMKIKLTDKIEKDEFIKNNIKNKKSFLFIKLFYILLKEENKNEFNLFKEPKKFEEDLKNYLKNNKLNKKKKKQKEKKIQTNLDDEELNILQDSFEIIPNQRDQSMRTMSNVGNNLVDSNGQIERRRSLSDINDNVLKRIARSKNLNTSHSRRTNALTFLATPGRIFNSRNKNSNNSSFLNRSGRALRKFFSRN